MTKCSTCKTSIMNLQGNVSFKCPSCGKYDIVRCKQCRTIAAKFHCQGCGFEGPN